MKSLVQSLILRGHEAAQALTGSVLVVRQVKDPNVWAHPKSDGNKMIYQLDSDCVTRDGIGTGAEYLHVPVAHPYDTDYHPVKDWGRERIYAPWSVGEQRWVKETWAWDEKDNEAVYRAGGWEDSQYYKWRSPVHMLRDTSRTTLKLRSVQAKRLQGITNNELVLVGAENHEWLDFMEWVESVAPPGTSHETLREHYEGLWNKSNRPQWFELNPFCWFATFDAIEGGE